MHSNKERKRTPITSGFTLFLIIFNLLIPFSYATHWSPDTRLTWDESLDWAPSIAQAQDGTIWVVWHFYEIGSNPDILYKVYNGSSTFPWSPTKKLTIDQHDDMTPSITTTADGNIWVVWSSNRDENLEIYYKIYNGSSWSPDTRLTTDPSKDEFPSVTEDNDGDIWVVWSSNRTGYSEIHYRIYNGSSWQPCGQLTSDREKDWDPSIMQAQNGTIWIVWVRDEDLFYKVFFKNMTNIVPDTLLTEKDLNMDWHPSIMQAEDGRIWVTWESLNALDEMDIYCKIHDGVWSEERITYNSLDDLMPAIMQATDGTIWIAWTSNRLDNFDIYYKTDSPPQHRHDVTIMSVTHSPYVTVAYQGLNVSIEVVPQDQGLEAEFVQVNCYANSTLIGNQTVHLSAGQLMPLEFMWNTSNVIPGTYTIIANASIIGEIDTNPADNTFSDGVIQVRIPGDADFSGLVDLYDFGLWVKNYGRAPEEWLTDVYPDFDNDYDVDLYDFEVWRNNYGARYP